MRSFTTRRRSRLVGWEYLSLHAGRVSLSSGLPFPDFFVNYRPVWLSELGPVTRFPSGAPRGELGRRGITS